MMNTNDDEKIAREEERRREEEKRREAEIVLPGSVAGDQTAALEEEKRREAGMGLLGATGAAGNDQGRAEERRRETWIGLLGAAFLGAFLLIFFQGPLLQGAQSIFASPTSPVVQTSSGASSQGGVAAAAAVAGGTVARTAQTPVANSQVTPTVSAPTPTATLPPTTTTVEGPLIALFTGGRVAVNTAQSYSGPVTITVSGTGQAQGTFHSDAFYVYTDANGNTVAPSHHTYATLCINGQRVDQFVQPIPAYNPAHIYKLTFTAPGGPLTFGVCDTILRDNTGSFTIMFK